ncbi:MAG: deoxyguanosinetriphosphate triphosphohydrolase [Chromatiales bacterium]|jgi:dGTPase|nr:deoxyguanosinetriphosphate triphosphohydrolase [Chromatiales bacterium]
MNAASERGVVPAGVLMPYAASTEVSRGRRHAESSPLYRSEYQRDRDRIVHSGAFRRLEYKTQVFVNHEGDMFRTRLTHSVEVAQIARSAARALGLNEDLIEAIALAHDLGHTPFGHAGQDALNRCMKDYGGFEHNLQSLRVVDELEERYAEFDGLNLTYETREGILKHCSMAHAGALGELGERFLHKRQPGLEAQLANLADEIAYNNHDVDDGLRSGLITVEQLNEVALFAEQYREVMAAYPALAQRRLLHEVVRRMINAQVTDLVETSRAAIATAAPRSIEEVRSAPAPLIGFSGGMRTRLLDLKRFLREELYQHYRVRRMTAKADRVVGNLFDAFMKDAHLLPPDYQRKIAQVSGDVQNIAARARVVADYVAGMTDRYAIGEYERLFDPARLT